jgi:hypothetical protein
MSPNSLDMSNYSRTNLQPTNRFLKKFCIKILRLEMIEIVNLRFLNSWTKTCTNLWTWSVISDSYFYEIKLCIDIDIRGGRGNIDGVATCYRLDDPGIELWRRKLFPSPSPLRTSLRSNQPPVQLIPRSFLELRPLDRGVSTLPPPPQVCVYSVYML